MTGTVLDDRLFLSIVESLATTVQRANCRARAQSQSIDFRFFLDDSVAACCTRHSASNFSIFFPTGLFNRVYMLARIVVSPVSGNGLTIKLSPTDRRDISIFIPSRLVQIFDPEAPIEEFWARDLLHDYPVSQSDETIVSFIVRAGLLFILFHELAHVQNGHFEFRRYLNLKPDICFN
jgi:hypothetical protein